MSGPPLIGPGANVKFYTANRFLDRSDKEIGTRISAIDKMAKDTFVVAEQMCPGLQDQTAALGKLDVISKLYAGFLDDLETDKVSKTSTLYKTTDASMNNAIYYKQKLAADIQDCINRKVYPELNDAINTNAQAEQSKTGSSDNKEDAAIRAKIKRSKIINNPCKKLRGFSDYAGGVGYKRFFEDYMTAPFELTNYGKELRGTLGTMLFGPPGTGKTLLAEAVADALANYDASFYSITASTIKGKYVGESEKSMTFLFEEARNETKGGKKPVVIFIDEADGLLDEKSATSGGGTGLLAQLNSEMEGLSNSSNKGLIVIIATNYPEVIPTAALSRFVNKIYVGLPNRDDVREMLVTSLEAMGDARYNLSGPIDEEPADPADFNKPNIEKKPRKKRLMTYLTLKEMGKEQTATPDSVDFIAEVISQRRFSPREIDGLFTYIRGIIYGTSRDFYKDPIPEGAYLPPGKSYIEYQHWIWDRTTFRHRIMKDGVCGPTQEDSKDVIIPIGFLPENTATREQYGTLGQLKLVDKLYWDEKLAPKPGKKKERFQIITYRKLIKEDGKDEEGRWEYYLVAKENDTEPGYKWMNDSDHTSGDFLTAERMHTILGPVQITMKHFEDAFNEIKPVTIKNARKMLAYAMNPGRTIEKMYARGFDLQMLKEMAQQEQNNEEQGGSSEVGDLQKLIRDADIKIKSYTDPSFREFTWNKWMAQSGGSTTVNPVTANPFIQPPTFNNNFNNNNANFDPFNNNFNNNNNANFDPFNNNFNNNNNANFDPFSNNNNASASNFNDLFGNLNFGGQV